jgi:signal transduction histidine kinase
VHELQSNLHVISVGVDLLCLAQADRLECQTVVNGVKRASRLLKEVREYFLPPETHLSPESLAAVLQEVVHHEEKEWHRQGVRLRMACRSPLPLVQLDLQQFRPALERVIAFACALLPRGGELEIEAGLRKISGQRYVELKVASCSTTSLAVEEKDVFQPFLRVNNYQAGLSLALACQTLHRHSAKIFFHKESPKRGLFTILLVNSAQ